MCCNLVNKKKDLEQFDVELLSMFLMECHKSKQVNMIIEAVSIWRLFF